MMCFQLTCSLKIRIPERANPTGPIWMNTCALEGEIYLIPEMNPR
jgi:hypothetical protein